VKVACVVLDQGGSLAAPISGADGIQAQARYERPRVSAYFMYLFEKLVAHSYSPNWPVTTGTTLARGAMVSFQHVVVLQQPVGIVLVRNML
jgi:hypothetical protein